MEHTTCKLLPAINKKISEEQNPLFDTNADRNVQQKNEETKLISIYIHRCMKLFCGVPYDHINHEV
jgi:hypothetical protein